MSRIHWRRMLGLGAEFEVRTAEDFAAGMRVWKEKVVAARAAGDDGLAADLSQCKEALKREFGKRQSRVCPDCGGSKSSHSERCRMCRLRRDVFGNAFMPENFKEYAMEEAVPVTMINRDGEMMSALRRLERVGQSFVTAKMPTTIYAGAKKVGMKIIVRTANPQEKDRKKRFYRVWRSDGKTAEEVNLIIQERLTGGN